MPDLNYTVFGLEVRSEIPLPELHRSLTPAARPDVMIRLHTKERASDKQEPGFFADADAALLNIRNVGRYRIVEGREIIVQPDPAASARDLRLFLLGSAFGAILHQRGVLPLHANAVEIGGKAVAFAGSSGAGKSTLAAWFLDRGSHMISDDVCAISFPSDAHPVVHGGLPRLRLCSDALAASGRNVLDFRSAFDGVNKYEVPAPATSAPSAIPLGAIYLLSRAERPNSPQKVQQLSGVEALEVLVANTYRGSFVHPLGSTKQHLATCLELAQRVPVFKAARRWGFANFDEEAEGLKRHASQLILGKLSV